MDSRFVLPQTSALDDFVAFRAEVPYAAFDGNDSAATTRWLFPNEKFTHLEASLATRLMAATCEDQLDWVLFVTNGYRIA